MNRFSVHVAALVLMLLCSACSSGRDGVYVRENLVYDADTLVIDGDRLYLDIKYELYYLCGKKERPVNETAVCSLKYEGRKHMRLWSMDVPSAAFKDSVVRYSGSVDACDSVTVALRVPNLNRGEESMYGPVFISFGGSIYIPDGDWYKPLEEDKYYVKVRITGVSGETEHSYEKEWVFEDAEIKIPNIYEKIRIRITPYVYMYTPRLKKRDGYREIYSPLYFESDAEGIEVKGERMSIELPEVKPSLFRKWYFNGDYMTFDGDTVVYRRYKFVKQKNRK